MRSRASSAWAREIVTDVTRQPRVAARCIAIPPQPVPISRTSCDGPTSASSASASYFRRCAVSSVSPGSNTAHEYVIVSSRKSAKSSFERS